MSVVFLTGAAGFLGRTLCRRLVADGHEVIALVRSHPADFPPGVEPVRGDLTDPTSYAGPLARAEAVIHAAAVTGNAPASEYQRVNVEGTQALLSAAGDAPLVLISSVAAGFRRDYRYFYAHSKRKAERLVAATTRPHVILRPTMIFGPAAPVAAGLTRLARLPVVPVFGSGRVEVQPVHVNDLAGVIVEVLRTSRFDRSTIDVGGPETTSIEDLLLRLRAAAGGSAPHLVHLPLQAVVPPLTLLELVARPLLPVTVGQLASFANPGTARPDPLVDGLRPDMVSLAVMVEESVPPS